MNFSTTKKATKWRSSSTCKVSADRKFGSLLPVRSHPYLLLLYLLLRSTGRQDLDTELTTAG